MAGQAATISAYARVPAQPFASVALTVKLNVPLAVGVPASAPAPDRFSPFGSAPSVRAKPWGAVPPVAASVWLYAAPCVPAGSVAGLSVMAGHVTVSVKPASRVAPQLSVARMVMTCVPLGCALATVTTPVALFTLSVPVNVPRDCTAMAATLPLSLGPVAGVIVKAPPAAND